MDKAKECFKCGGIMPLSEFYEHPRMSDGHLGKCKGCTKKDVSENYRLRKKHYTTYEKERFKDPERKAKAKQYQKKRRERYPEKDRATKMVHRAIAKGLIKKAACEVCGEVKVEGHHDDYSKPLEVRWLCFKHHREVHGQEVV